MENFEKFEIRKAINAMLTREISTKRRKFDSSGLREASFMEEYEEQIHRFRKHGKGKSKDDLVKLYKVIPYTVDPETSIRIDSLIQKLESLSKKTSVKIKRILDKGLYHNQFPRN